MINDEKIGAIKARLRRLGADGFDCVIAVRGDKGLDELTKAIFDSSDSSLGALMMASTPSLAAFLETGTAPDVSLIPDAKLICGRIAVCGEAGAPDEFSAGCRAAMTGERFIVGGADLTEALMRFEALDQCAQLTLEARLLGAEPKRVSEKHLAVYRLFVSTGLEAFTPKSRPDGEDEAREELCRIVRLACSDSLFGGAQGTISKRLSDGSFVITPYGSDRSSLTPEDLVLIESGRRESGKNPSRSALLHAAIYGKNPGVGSIICAHPQRIMAFAVTDAELDAEKVGGTVVKFPFGASFMQRELFAGEISSKPACILENDCVITTGKTPEEAYERLSALEFAAGARICSAILTSGK